MMRGKKKRKKTENKSSFLHPQRLFSLAHSFFLLRILFSIKQPHFLTQYSSLLSDLVIWRVLFSSHAAGRSCALLLFFRFLNPEAEGTKCVFKGLYCREVQVATYPVRNAFSCRRQRLYDRNMDFSSMAKRYQARLVQYHRLGIQLRARHCAQFTKAVKRI